MCVGRCFGQSVDGYAVESFQGYVVLIGYGDEVGVVVVKDERMQKGLFDCPG